MIRAVHCRLLGKQCHHQKLIVIINKNSWEIKFYYMECFDLVMQAVHCDSNMRHFGGCVGALKQNIGDAPPRLRATVAHRDRIILKMERWVFF